MRVLLIILLSIIVQVIGNEVIGHLILPEVSLQEYISYYRANALMHAGLCLTYLSMTSTRLRRVHHPRALFILAAFAGVQGIFDCILMDPANFGTYYEWVWGGILNFYNLYFIAEVLCIALVVKDYFFEKPA